MKTEITELLTQLADKLGTTTEYLWGVLITQAKAEGIMAIIFLAVSVIIIATTILLYYIKIKIDYSGYPKYDMENGPLDFMVIMTFLSLLSIIPIIVSVKTIIIAFMNPEYFALKTIIEIL